MNENKELKIFFMSIIFALLLAIIATSAYLIIVPNETETFTTLGFTSPSTLPNNIPLNEEQPFEYSVTSFESSETTYNVTTTLELYRLYDVTEGLHSCLRPYRKKIFLDWTNTTTLHNETKEVDFKLEGAQEQITWTEYYAVFDFEREQGQGIIRIEAEHKENTSYTIEIDLETQTIQIGESKHTLEDLPSRFIVQMHIQDTNANIKILDQGKRTQYFETIITQINTPTEFNIFAERMFVKPNMQIYHTNPIEVPDRENVIDVVVDMNRYYTLLSQAKKNIHQSVSMVRVYDRTSLAPVPIYTVDEELDEEENETILNEQEKTELFEQYFQTTNITYVQPFLEQQPEFDIISRFFLRPVNISHSVIPWSDFILTSIYDVQTTYSSISYVFGSDLAIVFTNQSLFVVEPGNLQQFNLSLQRLREQQPQRYAITMIANETHLRIQTAETIDNEIIVSLSQPLTNQTLQTYQANTFGSAVQLQLTKNIPECKDMKEAIQFCQKTYSIQTARQIQLQEYPRDAFGSFEIKQPNQVLSGNDTPTQSTTTDNAITQQIQDEVSISGIPTTIQRLDGLQARIINRTDFGISLSYIHLGGNGTLHITFVNEDADEVFRIAHQPIMNTTTLFIDDMAIPTTSIPSLKESQQIALEVKEEHVLVLFNNEELLDVALNTSLFLKTVLEPDTNTTKEIYSGLDGYFTIITEDMHIERQNAILKRGISSTRIPYFEDPCRLRLVQTQILEQKELQLEPEQAYTQTLSFIPETFFDYGKVSVDLNGGSNMNSTAQHIHFWVVRD